MPSPATGTVLEVGAPSSATEVLLVHAPYPGRLRFVGVPSSLLGALAPYVRRVAATGGLGRVGLLDPGEASEGFYEALGALLGTGQVRAVCVSTSTAAIEEAARIAGAVKALAPDALVILGGPHEDGCRGAALHVTGVDLSLAGDCGEALSSVLTRFLAQDRPPSAFLSKLGAERSSAASGVPASSLHWHPPGQRFLEPIAPRSLGAEPLVMPSNRVRFDVFPGRDTIPLMVSKGCSYGRCTFCAESNGHGAEVARSFEWVALLAEVLPQAALYFQDSIFPSSQRVRQQLLPLLGELERPWGCQVFLPAVSRDWLRALRASGCTYLYTGLESGSRRILEAIGKTILSRSLVLERLGWIRDEGFQVGLSFMFGSMTTNGVLLESADTLQETESLVEAIKKSGVSVAGFYPNVQTVLPGTALAHGLKGAGYQLDFYRMPRCKAFEAMEDGAVGYNFVTLAPADERTQRQSLAKAIAGAASRVMARD